MLEFYFLYKVQSFDFNKVKIKHRLSVFIYKAEQEVCVAYAALP